MRVFNSDGEEYVLTPTEMVIDPIILAARVAELERSNAHLASELAVATAERQEIDKTSWMHWVTTCLVLLFAFGFFFGCVLFFAFSWLFVGRRFR